MSILREKQARLVGVFTAIIGTLSVVAPARADVVTDWNAITLGVVNAGARPGPSGILDSAMVHIAMHDDIQAFQHRFETYNEPIAGASGSPVAAVATAARDVLVNRFPAQTEGIDKTYWTYHFRKGSGRSFGSSQSRLWKPSASAPSRVPA